MVSRLDRLFILLDTGSNEAIRLAAAKQLGEVQKVQPQDLDYLLRRIQEYSYKPVWETRVAAGQTTRCVLEQIEPWPPSTTKDEKSVFTNESAEKLIKYNVNTEKILDQFDLEKTISCCPKLLSLDIIETDDSAMIGPSSSKSQSRGKNIKRKDLPSKKPLSKSDAEQLMRQRKLINKELGIAMVDSLNLDVKSTDIVTNDDLQVEYDASVFPVASMSAQHDVRSFIQQNSSNYERIYELLLQSGCIKKFVGSDSTVPSNRTQNCWPLTDIARQYADNLFNPSWEIRHGAAIALREIVKLQGKCAGRILDLNEVSNDMLNQLWLVDTALKAISVLILDKFGDFLFDQVIAPVRENAAQLLGCCVANMSESNINGTIGIILKMLENDNWETRHGGILGLKYSLIAVEEPISKKMLHRCFDPIFKCLEDPVDDVAAEAAASLVPVKDLMIETIPEKAPSLIKFLWTHLADLDELTTSTSNIVMLLASLITSCSAQLEPTELIDSIPKLWSLLGHSSTTVRSSVLKALITLMKPQKTTCLSWMTEELLSTALRLIFQRSILENMEEVRPYIEEVWLSLIKIDDDLSKSKIERFNLLKITSQFLNYWLCLTMQPYNTPIDRSSPMWLNIGPDGTISCTEPDTKVYIGSSTFNTETENLQKQQVVKCRLLGTRLIGALYANLVNDFDESIESQHAKEALNYLAEMFINYIKTKSANQRMISGWAIESWACHQKPLLSKHLEKLRTLLPESLIYQLNVAIQEVSFCYDELASTFTRLQQETRDFVSAARDANIKYNLSAPSNKRVIYNLNQIQSLCELNLDAEISKVAYKKSELSSRSTIEHDTSNTIYTSLYSKKENLTKSLRTTNLAQKNLSTSVLSSLACALISWQSIPEKTKLVTEPLLESVEIEEEQSLQEKSVKYLVALIDILTKNPSQYYELIEDILKRLVDVIFCETLSPILEPGDSPNNVSSTQLLLDSTVRRSLPDIYKIVLLDNLQRRAELNRASSRRQSSINSTSSLKRSHSLTSTTFEADVDPTIVQDEPFNTRLSDIKVRGTSNVLCELVVYFGYQLPDRLPRLWNSITCDIKQQVEAQRKLDKSFNETDLIKSLKLLTVVGKSLDSDLKKHLLDLFLDLISLLNSSNPILRHLSSHCIGVISKVMLSDTIELIKKHILPMLEESDNPLSRCGSIEAVALIIEHLQLDLVPQINTFIIHVLRRMSDQNDQVRLMATHCFGKLLSLMPLNLENNSDDVKRSDFQQADQRFIEQLFNPKKLENFVLPFEMDFKLRSYQQDGLNWLAFLNRFNLHGILCDEMGLGKTFMTICVVASEHFGPKMDVEQADQKKSLPSLILCPSTLTEHWLYEINKFLPDDVISKLNPVAYSGILSERVSLRCQILSKFNRLREDYAEINSEQQIPINLVVASYEIVRNDIDFFRQVNWNYCVLDEGHMIKNGKTKLSKAIRLLNAKHRLILSGTPIQNNVTELWSLFDFLMPGFLGSERQFNSRYAKPILQSRELKCSARDLEAGALAMESLHRQVLPFILRRLKEDVLDDLPPKIIQDYYCELSPLQLKLYEDFTRSKLCKEVTRKSVQRLDSIDDDSSNVKVNSKSHVFQALRYLKNVCNHPKLVMSEKHCQFEEIRKYLDSEKSSLDDITQSSKLKALNQLLIDCGIGVASQSGDEQQALGLQAVVNQHRALIFCQIRSMVEIIENDLLKKHLPDVTYLKLDGTVPANRRHSIVSRFNNDPSIDILLLTTQIGGLGLNLTGADTVIFVEHDWNPTRDLQAMDRAHRIGQKKVVNVYRLITKGTLEEKIMGLQKFKTTVSNTVINQDNTGLGTMNVEQLFDLFDSTATDSNSRIASNSERSNSSSKSKSSLMELLPELWDQQQYETEYDLSSFVSSLKN